jgi:type IV pilus assembly protein PilB
VSPSAFFTAVAQRGIASETECRDILRRQGDDEFEAMLALARTRPRAREEIGHLWGTSMGVAYVNPARTLIYYDLVTRLPEDFARQAGMLPLYEMGGAVTVAMARPLDQKAVRKAENLLNGFVSAVFAFPDQIESALEVAFQTETGIEQLLDASAGRLLGRKTTLNVADLERLSRDEAIVRFTRGLLLLALKQRASDIHIEPGPKELRIRFRIDGVLREVLHLESALHPPIVSRLKVMARLDIADTRRSQDGRIELEMPDRSVDVRVSTVATIYGEKLVLRMLGHSQATDVPDLSELDFCAPVLAGLERVIQSPSGLFFVTGPTGSGKTTTLSALLRRLSNPEVNICTIEDPVEYAVEGVNQVPVNEAADMTFAALLRAMLRQDPDVILVGEIRDAETASVATRAALTGHLVLTTLHTTDSLQVMNRMLDLGVDPTLLAPSVLGSMAQRLVRRLCGHCREAHEPAAEELRRFFTWHGARPPAVKVHRAKGCQRCGQTGYFGRIGIHELMPFGPEMERLVARRASAAETEECAERLNFRPLVYDGLKKVLMGLTTFDEILRVTVAD